MIEVTYPSKRKEVSSQKMLPPPSRWNSPYELHQASLKKIGVSEWLRRENIVVEAWRLCQVNVGDTCWPASLKDYEKYGAFIVQGLYRSYRDMEDDYKWPASDKPLILTILQLKEPKDVLFCTVDWVAKRNPHMNYSPT
jgi:hypothetical protein